MKLYEAQKDGNEELHLAKKSSAKAMKDAVVTVQLQCKTKANLRNQRHSASIVVLLEQHIETTKQAKLKSKMAIKTANDKGNDALERSHNASKAALERLKV